MCTIVDSVAGNNDYISKSSQNNCIIFLNCLIDMLKMSVRPFSECIKKLSDVLLFYTEIQHKTEPFNVPWWLGIYTASAILQMGEKKVIIHVCLLYTKVTSDIATVAIILNLNELIYNSFMLSLTLYYHKGAISLCIVDFHFNQM